MNGFLSLVRMRLLPAALTAAGVALVTVGLISYAQPGGTVAPSPAPTTAVTPAPGASASARPSPSAASSASPDPSQSAPADRVATRVAIPALRIDLPVIRPDDGYPVCDVAMFLADETRQLRQPGQGRAVYLYAHARTGMFLPLLEASQVRDGAAMLGMIVQVWTSDEQVFLYEITEVRRHQTTLDDALAADHEQLWLQTSEGPRDPSGRLTPKLQVVAEPLSNGPAADPADAHPTPKPRECA